MRARRKWTDDEEQVVISKVKANPNNLSKAFREASLEINMLIIFFCKKCGKVSKFPSWFKED